jgi:hypothetical protein
MAYAIKYRLRYETSKFKKDVKLDIYPKDYAGAGVYKRIGQNNITLQKEKSGKIRATSINFSIQSDIDSEFASFYSEDNKKHLVKLLIDDILIWQGFIVSDQYSEPYIAPPYDVEITATDGLGLLKNYNFELTGVVSRFDAIRHCLDKIGLNIGYAINIDLFETRMITSRAMLEQLYFNAEALAEKNCYEALEFLIPDGCVITQSGNRWLIQREREPAKSRFLYSYTGVYEIIQPGETVQYLGSLSDPDTGIYPINGNLTRTFKSAWKNFTIKNNYGKLKSFLKNHDFSYGDDSYWNVQTPTFSVKKLNEVYYGYIVGNATSAYQSYVSQSVTVKDSPYRFIFSLKFDAFGYDYYSSVDGFAPWNVNVIIQVKLTGQSTYYLNTTTGWVTDEQYISQKIKSSVGSSPNWHDLKIIAAKIPTAGTLEVKVFKGYVPEAGSSTRFEGIVFTECRVYTEELDKFDNTEEIPVYFSDNRSESNETIEVLPVDLPDYNNAELFFLNGNLIDLAGVKYPSRTWISSGEEARTYNNYLAVFMAKMHAVPRQVLTGNVRGENMHLNALIQHNLNDQRQFYVETGEWDILNDTWNVTLIEILGSSLTPPPIGEVVISPEVDPIWGLITLSILDNAEAIFYRYAGNELVNKYGSSASVITGYVIFPELTTDIFDRSDSVYWSGLTIIDSNPRKWPLAELINETLTTKGTEATQYRLFWNDYQAAASDILPVVVFAEALTAEEKAQVEEYVRNNQIISGPVVEENDHVEKDTLTDLQSKEVTISFLKEFKVKPMLTHLRVYRWSDIVGTGYWKMQDVEWHYTSSQPVSTTGFSLVIDDSEDLEGVIIDYKFE